MLDFLKRSQLIRRGLASRKTRRRRTKNELLHSLEYAAGTKYFIFAAFIAGIAALIFSGQQPEPTKNFVISLLFFATALTQLDQSADDVPAQLAVAPCFRRHFRPARRDKVSSRALQQRFVQF